MFNFNKRVTFHLTFQLFAFLHVNQLRHKRSTQLTEIVVLTFEERMIKKYRDSIISV